MVKDNENTRSWILLLCVLCLVLVFLLIRHLGLYPFVFLDEYLYSTFSRLIPFKNATIPDYLYYAIFKVTNSCGDSSLGCARLLNTVFFVSAAPFIYLISKDVTGDKTALLIAVCSVLGPINSYTAYFMPESLYYFTFWSFTYLLFRCRQEICWQGMMISGAGLGLLSLVKPHALLLIPALVVYFIVFSRNSGKAGAVQSIKLIVVFLAAIFSVKLMLGFALAGINGLCLFGPDYYSGVSGSIRSQYSYLNLIENAVLSLQGHVVALCLLFSVPVTYLVLYSYTYVMAPRDYRLEHITVYTTLILASLLMFVAAFTATTVGNGPDETNSRLHFRYYNFIFPLLFMVAALQSTRSDSDFKLKWRVMAAFPVGTAILYATYTKMAPYFSNLIDNPELYGITANTKYYYVICGISFLCLVVGVYSPQLGARFFLYLFVPVSMFVSGSTITKEMLNRRVPDSYDEAGMFTKHYLSRDDLSNVLIVGSDKYKLYRSLFYLGNSKATIETISEGAAYNVSHLPEGKEWALVIGEHPLPDNVFYKISLNGFTLIRARKPNYLSFKTNNWPGFVANTSGLGAPESFGTWSTGKEVVIEFCEPLPERFRLSIIAQTFGPNVGRNFVIRIGNTTQEFRLGTSSSECVLEISNRERSKLVKLIVPQPVSPRELGLGGDGRQLGLGLVELRIDQIPNAP